MCGALTRKLLFKDKKLDIPICSVECEHKYIDALSSKDTSKVLSRIDHRITEARLHNRVCWITAGSGVLLFFAAFLTKSFSVFIAGASLMSLGAFLTRYFEHKMTRLTRLRKRIAI